MFATFAGVNGVFFVSSYSVLPGQCSLVTKNFDESIKSEPVLDVSSNITPVPP